MSMFIINLQNNIMLLLWLISVVFGVYAMLIGGEVDVLSISISSLLVLLALKTNILMSECDEKKVILKFSVFKIKIYTEDINKIARHEILIYLSPGRLDSFFLSSRKGWYIVKCNSHLNCYSYLEKKII